MLYYKHNRVLSLRKRLFTTVALKEQILIDRALEVFV